MHNSISFDQIYHSHMVWATIFSCLKYCNNRFPWFYPRPILINSQHKNSRVIHLKLDPKISLHCSKSYPISLIWSKNQSSCHGPRHRSVSPIPLRLHFHYSVPYSLGPRHLALVSRYHHTPASRLHTDFLHILSLLTCSLPLGYCSKTSPCCSISSWWPHSKCAQYS